LCSDNTFMRSGCFPMSTRTKRSPSATPKRSKACFIARDLPGTDSSGPCRCPRRLGVPRTAPRGTLHPSDVPFVHDQTIASSARDMLSIYSADIQICTLEIECHIASHCGSMSASASSPSSSSSSASSASSHRAYACSRRGARGHFRGERATQDRKP